MVQARVPRFPTWRSQGLDADVITRRSPLLSDFVAPKTSSPFWIGCSGWASRLETGVLAAQGPVMKLLQYYAMQLDRRGELYLPPTAVAGISPWRS
jgi:hypothetical protein